MSTILPYLPVSLHRHLSLCSLPVCDAVLVYASGARRCKTNNADHVCDAVLCGSSSRDYVQQVNIMEGSLVSLTAKSSRLFSEVSPQVHVHPPHNVPHWSLARRSDMQRLSPGVFTQTALQSRTEFGPLQGRLAKQLDSAKAGSFSKWLVGFKLLHLLPGV